MGKRSGVPHRDDELTALSIEELRAELRRAKIRSETVSSAKMKKLAQKQIHWVSKEIDKRKAAE